MNLKQLLSLLYVKMIRFKTMHIWKRCISGIFTRYNFYRNYVLSGISIIQYQFQWIQFHFFFLLYLIKESLVIEILFFYVQFPIDLYVLVIRDPIICFYKMPVCPSVCPSIHVPMSRHYITEKCMKLVMRKTYQCFLSISSAVASSSSFS